MFALRRSRSECELLKPYATAAWDALQIRYHDELKTDEIAYLYGHYLLGLTEVAHRAGAPEIHLAVYRALLDLTLSADEAEGVLHGKPEFSQAWVESALSSLERIGRKDGEALLSASDDSKALRSRPLADVSEPEDG